MFKDINKKKKRLDSLRPLPIETVKSIREKVLLDWTYNSNAIEGNTLTLIETKVILEGITVGGKTLREHLEVVNHREAILYIEDIVKNKEELTEWQIRNIHRLILKGINDSYAGVYRDKDVLIAGASHIPPEHIMVKEKMSFFIQKYNKEFATMHPIERASRVHADFVLIHPFIDGNGRTARLLLNFELMKNGYPPVVIKTEDRLSYYENLDKCSKMEYRDFIKMVAREVEKSLDLYLKLIDK